MEAFDVVDLIRAKRDGAELGTEEIRWLVDAYARGYVAEEQMSAMTMAIFLRGMQRREITDLTLAITASGDRMSFEGLGKATVDKHSTGGVGDKITLPLVPLVASFGVAVPQLSGRGLGHTGGTLDKFESIQGWRASLSTSEIREQLESVGAVVCAAGATLAPADAKLYALRDITATVESIPLLASSIMSKKLAEGTSALVLDVKFGSGAFLQDIAQSRALAETMVAIGTDAGLATTAFLTDMNVPLGRTIGNANEVGEALDVLAGGGPPDVVELTLVLAREMLALAGQPDADVEAALADGRAMDSWRAMVTAQGGVIDAPLPVARETHTVFAESDGVLIEQRALAFGLAAWRLGAGRARREDPVQHAAGIELHAKPGDAVKRGQPLFTLSADEPERFARALQALDGAYRLGTEEPRREALIRERVASLKA